MSAVVIFGGRVSVKEANAQHALRMKAVAILLVGPIRLLLNPNFSLLLHKNTPFETGNKIIILQMTSKSKDVKDLSCLERR